jgi:hypothetical protein
MGKFDDQHKIKLVKAGQERITMNNKWSTSTIYKRFKLYFYY